ncbi:MULTISPECIES: cytosine deaminase [unclassified Marinitoga]|uniref:cytosine deaminase n=1 Tax=unclassified Marinitoga TaxID=2640159 RepID=UPI000ADDF81B|nr:MULTISPECIES: cytosine deaminase [unclassified Marinitoga]
MKMIIRNAHIGEDKELKDIFIENGKIIKIGKIEEKAEIEIDADGKLVSPPFVDPHVHLDAVLTVGDPQYNISGTLWEGIEIWSKRKLKLTHEDVKKRAKEALKWAVAQGILKVRTHVDVCDPELTALKAMVEVKQEMKELVDVQIVSFPQEGIVSFPDGENLMRKSLEIGADIVGGIPHYEFSRDDGIKSIDIIMDLAKSFDKDIDVHIDETDDDQSRFVEYLAAKTIKENYFGRVTASHITAMHSYNNAYAYKLMSVFKKAQLNVIANPLDNIALQGRFDNYPIRRGMTRIKELLKSGINVGLGHDSVMDPWYPLGRYNMLQVAFMALNVGHMTGYNEINEIFDAITYNSAKLMNLSDYGIKEGNKADLIILNAPSKIEAIRLRSEVLYVIKNGNIIAKTTPAKSYVNDEEISFRVIGIYE